MGKADDLVPDMNLPLGKAYLIRRGLIAFGQMVGDAIADCVAGRLHRHAVQVRPRRRRRGRGIGHLARIRRRDLDRRQVNAKAVGGDLRDLLEEALTHFRAAVVQVDRPVLIDMHQRPRLIKVGEGERNAELDRRQRDAAFQDRLRRVPVGNGGAAGGVV